MKNAGSTLGECYLTIDWEAKIVTHLSPDLSAALLPKVYLSTKKEHSTTEYIRKTIAMCILLGLEIVNKNQKDS